MSPEVKLTNRQQHILQATVRHYIATAEPVGSGALVRDYNLSVSSATIRNAMGVLEKVGLLYQPHTSAGRVPSDSGYRIYVDRLMTPDPQRSAQQAEQLLNDRINRVDWSLEALLRGSAQILAMVSGYIALITTPQAQAAQLRHVQLMPVDVGRIMLIVVTDNYETQSTLIELTQASDSAPDGDEELLERELQILSNFLNSHLRGKAIADLATLDLSELDREFQRYSELLRTALVELLQRSRTPSSMQLMMSGLSEVLRQPEFSEVQQIQAIVHLLEDEQDQLLPLIFEPSSPTLQPGRRLTIRIGSENPLEPIQGCTLIASTYCKGDTPVGSVGVLGPTRMTYENAIALVEATADYLSDALSQ